MESKQLGSQEESRLENPKENKFEETLSEQVRQSNIGGGKPTNSDISWVMTDEVLRHKIRALIADEKPKASKLHCISTNPLVLVIVGFLLSGIIGGILTHHYGIQQQELVARRSFADELNKLRIQKIGEVWEQVDRNEIILDNMLHRSNKAPGSDHNKDDFDNIEKLIDEDIAIISKNRFWLGESAYNQLKDYLDKTGRYVSDMLLGPPGIDLSEALKKREQAKQDILQIRIVFLKGEPELNR